MSMKELRIEGRSGPANAYSITVDGQIVEGSAANVGPPYNEDTISDDGKTAEGLVYDNPDSWRYSGKITSFSIDRPGDVQIYKNGELVGANDVVDSPVAASIGGLPIKWIALLGLAWLAWRWLS